MKSFSKKEARAASKKLSKNNGKQRPRSRKRSKREAADGKQRPWSRKRGQREATDRKQREATATEPKARPEGSHRREATATEPKSRTESPILKSEARTPIEQALFGELGFLQVFVSFERFFVLFHTFCFQTLPNKFPNNVPKNFKDLP